MDLDALDHRLIALLRQDARASITTIASALGVARGTAHARLNRLVEHGVIRRFTIELDSPGSSERIRAVMMIEVQGSRGRQVVAELRRRHEVRSLHSTNGAWDFVAELETGSLVEFDRALAAIREIPGVLNSETCLLLDRAI